MNMEDFIEYNLNVPPKDKYEMSLSEAQRRIEELESEIDYIENNPVDKSNLKNLTNELYELQDLELKLKD